MRKGKGEVVARYKVMTSKGKRPKFSDVYLSIYEQLDDLGHDLRNALIVAPKGATFRQVGMALRRIERVGKEEFDEILERRKHNSICSGSL